MRNIILAFLVSAQAFGGQLNVDTLTSNSGASLGKSSAPAASALLDMVSTSKGLAPPRMTTTQKNAISSPLTGLIVYDTNLNALQIYNGSSWVTAGGGGIAYAADTGSANAYAIAPTTPALAYNTGDMYAFKVANANTTASTLNVSSLGTKNIKTPQIATLPAGALAANAIAIVVYDGTQFQLVNQQDPSRVDAKTTKGDLNAFDTAPTRLPVGSDFQPLIADSSQAKGVRYAHRSEMGYFNLIPDGGFESAAVTTNWTASGGTLIQTTTAGTYEGGAAAASWDSSSAAQTIVSTSYAIPSGNGGFSGQNLVASCAFKCSSGNTCTHTITADDGSGNNFATPFAITSSTSQFVRNSVNFIAPSSGNIRLKIASVASNEPIVYVDDCYLGLAAGFNVSQVNQSVLVASGFFAPTASCDWSRNNATLGAFSTTAACPGPTVEFNPGPGVLATTDVDLPKWTITGMAPGIYEVVVTAQMNTNGAAGNVASIAVNDGTTTSGESAILMQGTATSGPSVTSVAYFNYTTAADHTFQLFGAASSGSISIFNESNNAKLRFSVKMISSPAQTAYRPDQTPASWSGSLAVASGWTTTSSTYADPSSGSGIAITELQNRNFGTVTAISGSLPGITFTPPRVGRYSVCAGGQISDSSVSTMNVRLVNGSGGIINGGQSPSEDNANFARNYSLCGILDIASIAATSVKIQAATNGGTLSIQAGNASGTPTVSWIIFELDAPMPAPLLQGSVVSGSTGVEGVHHITFGGNSSASSACTASPCTIAAQDGSWASSVTKSGSAGDYSVNVVAGTWSATPTCTVTTNVALLSGTGECFYKYSASTSTTLSMVCFNAAQSAGVNGTIDAICMGPH